jgi:hypothetical protein
MPRFTIVAAAALLAASASAQLTVVVPAGMAAAEGNTSNAFPWGRGGTGLLHQCVYDSTHFTSQGVTFPVLITGLRWRPNTSVALTASTYSTASVSLSTSPLDALATSTTLAANRGADFATVYSGPVSWAAQPAVVGPTPFGISVPFTTPFLYDPNVGDLNIECDLPIQTYSGGTPQLDVHGAGSLASRIYISTGYPGTGVGIRDLNHGVVVEVTYTPASGLYAGFTANATGGATPLAVQFTDTSFSSAPAGVLAWAWDFDGDTVVDSTLQNPSHVYTACGTYTVSLTVNDGVHPPSTFTRTNYIATDVVTPSFTYAPAGPGLVQFTDTSSPAPTSWAWDFDGDSVTDSTLQNPVWPFAPKCGGYPVTLNVSRLCRGPYATTQILSVGGATNSFTTVLTGGNGLSGVGSGNTFDIQVTNPGGINICSLSMAPYMATPVVGTPLACTVWVTDAAGGYLANHTNASVWRQVATGTGTFNGGTFTAPVPVVMNLSNSIYLPFGTFGMAVHMTAGSGVAYTNVTAPFTYSGPDFNIIAGNGKGSPFAAAANAGRAWNGTIEYSTVANGGFAGYGFFGAGCPSTLPISRLTAVTRPTIGTTHTVGMDNLPFAVAFMMTGLSNTTSAFGPLPLDLAPIGAPGCRARVSLDLVDGCIGTGNTASWSIAIPNNGALLGFLIYNQALVFDPAANAFGFGLSDAHAGLVGL